MKRKDLFYLIFFLTILIIRISIFLVPNIDIKFFDLVIHHFWFGILLISISIFIQKKYNLKKIYTFAIGLGLVIDELIFILLGAGGDKIYWGLLPLLGTILLVIGIFLIRKKIISTLNL